MTDLSKSETKLWMLRNLRNELLQESDWTQMPDSQLSEEKKLNGKNIDKSYET